MIAPAARPHQYPALVTPKVPTQFRYTTSASSSSVKSSFRIGTGLALPSPEASTGRLAHDLRAMADTKHRRVDELFIYARDLRKVVASMSERLTDEEADAFIRECKPEPLVGAADGGLERVYFHQYLNMLKDDS